MVKVSDSPRGIFLLHSHVLKQHAAWFKPVLSEEWHSPTRALIGSTERNIWHLEMYFDRECSLGLLQRKTLSLDRSFELPVHSCDCPFMTERLGGNKHEAIDFQKLTQRWSGEADARRMKSLLAEYIDSAPGDLPLPARKQFWFHDEQPHTAGVYVMQKGWQNDADINDSLVLGHVDPTYHALVHAYRTYLPEVSRGSPAGNLETTFVQALGHWESLWQAFFHVLYGFPVKFRHPGNTAANVCFLFHLHLLARYHQSDAVVQATQETLLGLPDLWRFVAKEPAFMACLGHQLELHEITDDAIRHMAAQRLFRSHFGLSPEWDTYYCSEEIFAENILPELDRALNRMQSSFEQRFLTFIHLLAATDGQRLACCCVAQKEALKSISATLLGTRNQRKLSDIGEQRLSQWNLIRFFELCKLSGNASDDDLRRAFVFCKGARALPHIRAILSSGLIGRLLAGFLKPVSALECRDWQESQYAHLDIKLGYVSDRNVLPWLCEGNVHFSRYKPKDYSTFDGCWRMTMPSTGDPALNISQSECEPATDAELAWLGLGSEGPLRAKAAAALRKQDESMSSSRSGIDMVEMIGLADWMHETFADDSSQGRGSTGRAVRYSRLVEAWTTGLPYMPVVMGSATSYMAAKLGRLSSSNGQ